jgi:type II secretory pathway pseudopilin PulG
MKISPDTKPADAKTMRRQGELAFTMVEIAISIGVIGFALVAIIGLLPRGMHVQQNTREDTVISQDAAYFLNAIGNGAVVSNLTGTFINSARGLDFLTNYVQSIRFDYMLNGKTNRSNIYYNTNFNSGAEIIGLLSTPQTNYLSPFFSNNFFYVSAVCRALSGPATTVNVTNNVMALTYRMEVMVTPFNSFAPFTTNYLNPNIDATESNLCYYRWLEAAPGANNNQAGAGALTYDLFNLRLRFSWPLFANGAVGEGRQTYCTVVAAQLAGPVPVNVNGVYGWFFQPQSFTNGMSGSL